MPPLLQVQELRVQVPGPGGRPVSVVDGVSFQVGRGETVGLVGESGCGKSVTAMALLGMPPEPGGLISGGRVVFDGRDLTGLTESGWRAVRGRRIGMIFQDPMSSLNPCLRVGEHVAEVLRVHSGLPRVEAARRAVELLSEVGIPEAESRAADFPHSFSGGMRQRVVIAMALACGPEMLLADEPTTALDVTVQAQILELLARERQERGMGLLLITHDLGVVARMADRVLVMYAGRIVEEAPAAGLFERPLHPYTRGLLDSLPGRGPGMLPGKLRPIPGAVPDAALWPGGCAFHPRCPIARDSCAREDPALAEAAPGHGVACPFQGAAVGAS